MEAAFVGAGADWAASFLSNGTLVFSIPDPGRVDAVVHEACASLRRQVGLKEPVFVRTLDYLSTLAALDPFARIAADSVYACCITFLPPPVAAFPATPLRSGRGDVEVLHFAQAEAMALSLRPGATPGSPNAFLEKLLGVQATTRNWNTLLRLLQRHA